MAENNDSLNGVGYHFGIKNQKIIDMGDLKQKFKGYGIAAWIILIGGVAVFGYGVKEILLESYEDWKMPVSRFGYN